ncbi:unnamed protein product [Meloidogyne enterolobii]|uniref:Uncharacterized protein n=1 Tax=Meloidogyne enterolobii TaxID=390850 RepID=A0ACB1AXH8_MELEN
MSNLDRKIIEHEGVKYYKKGGQWYQIFPIDNDKVPDEIKTTERLAKIDIPDKIQLDVLKCLTFNQLLSFQETSFYLKKFIDKYEKELARKKYERLEFVGFFIN